VDRQTDKGKSITFFADVIICQYVNEFATRTDTEGAGGMQPPPASALFFKHNTLYNWGGTSCDVCCQCWVYFCRKRLFLRNRMTDERLTGLALMYIHPEIEIDIPSVIDRFINQGASSGGKRRKIE